MPSRVLVGLSGPTFFDYQNVAGRAANDIFSSPNPILENALGLSVFYDEVWFMCESLCPQSLRGHQNIRYVDRHLSDQSLAQASAKVSKVLQEYDSSQELVAGSVCQGNFDDYWGKVKQAGPYWWNEPDRAIDNHSHGLEILGVERSANSNSVSTLLIDLQIRDALKEWLNCDLALNTFTKNIYNAIYPNQFDPLVDQSNQVICSTAIINAMVPNCMSKVGPSAEVFDKVSNSVYARQFRDYVRAQELSDAYACYEQLVHEIEDSVRREVRRAADRLHPIRGLTTLVTEVGHEILGSGALAKAIGWYTRALATKPISAAAFIVDLQSKR